MSTAAPPTSKEEIANPSSRSARFVRAYDGDALVGYISILPRGEADRHFKMHVQGAVLPGPPR